MVEVTDYNCAYYQNLLDAAPDQIDVAYIGDDPAGQLGMLMSPDHWRRYFKPALARLFDVVKSRGVRAMYHICGSFRPIIPDLIDIGADILMPLQFSAVDMNRPNSSANSGLTSASGVGLIRNTCCPTAPQKR